jgi:hypothetical protein
MIGGKSGIVTEATNHEANQRLTNAIEQMASKEYMQSRDLSDVIPTHAHMLPKKPKPVDNTPVFTLERKGDDDEQQAADEEDDELQFLRERRLAAMRKQQIAHADHVSKQHGTYREIAQDDFFNVVVRDKGGSDMACVHFYHKDFERCKIIDRHLTDLCQLMFHVKFVKIDVEKATFLADKLRVTMLPCLVLFNNDIAVDRVVGFEDMGNRDDFPMSLLQQRIEVGLKLAEPEDV